MSAAAVTPWQWAWREGVAPQLSTAGLKALQNALESDDPTLIQGQNLLPPPLKSHESENVVAACAICFAAWKGDYREAASVAEIDARFAEICFRAGELLNQPDGVGSFLTQYDSWTREEMRQNLLPEVRLALSVRQQPVPIKPPKRLASSTDKGSQISEKKIS
jgi:hypothetical protein